MTVTATPDTAMLLHAVELAPDGVIIVDDTGVIVYANAAMLQLSGYDELAGMTVEDLVPEALRGRHVGLRSGYQAEPSQRPMGAGLELVMKRADGWELPVEIPLSPFERRHPVLCAPKIGWRLYRAGAFR